MDFKKQVEEIFLKNQRIHDGKRYTVPSIESYPYQWLWDSCFHAIVLSYLDPKRAVEELRLAIARPLNSGCLPHMLFWDRSPTVNELHYYEWGVTGSSSITQPPLIAHALYQSYIRSHEVDESVLQDFVTALDSHYNYLFRERDIHQIDLVGIISPDESGEDNSPRFDRLLGLSPRHDLQDHLKKRAELIHHYRDHDLDPNSAAKHFFTYDVLFNSVLYVELEAFVKITKVLGESSLEKKWRRQLSHMRNSMRQNLWANGLYWNLDNDGELNNTVTWAALVPMFAGLYTEDEVKSIVGDLLSDDGGSLMGKYGVTSTGRNEPSYEPHPTEVIIGGYWRGPIWLAIHWFVYHGLQRYGLGEEAQNIKSKSMELIRKSGFCEIYDPETAQGMAAKEFTWGGLLMDMN